LTARPEPRRPFAAMVTRLWQGWTRLVQRVGALQARVVLTLLYFVVVAPFAVGLKLRSDPLRIGRVPGSNWTVRTGEPAGLPGARQQS
jgi:hypothetical protein